MNYLKIFGAIRKKILAVSLVFVIFLVFASSCQQKSKPWFGVFIADEPTLKEINQFSQDFGVTPEVIMIFLGWNSLLKPGVVQGIEQSPVIPMVTLEPWHAETKQGIDLQKLTEGSEDEYLSRLSRQLAKLGKPVYVRFAHEANGDWYPWSGSKIGVDLYKKSFRYVKKFFDNQGAKNAKWVFSINVENIPSTNDFLKLYPGDPYVDFIGLDGYNWGNTKTWSRWKSFDEIFRRCYERVAQRIQKPILITEFGTTSRGGDKSRWIAGVFDSIKRMKRVRGFILFNMDKESDWAFRVSDSAGKELKKQLNF